MRMKGRWYSMGESPGCASSCARSAASPATVGGVGRVGGAGSVGGAGWVGETCTRRAGQGRGGEGGTLGWRRAGRPLHHCVRLAHRLSARVPTLLTSHTHPHCPEDAAAPAAAACCCACACCALTLWGDFRKAGGVEQGVVQIQNEQQLLLRQQPLGSTLQRQAQPRWRCHHRPADAASPASAQHWWRGARQSNQRSP